MGIQSEEFWRRVFPPDGARRAAQNWVIGDEISHRHRIIQILGGPGKSGMGIVYVCIDNWEEEQPVAIKTLQNRFNEDRALIERFKWEAEVWVRLGRYHNIVEAKWVENHGGKPYVYLEYIAGDKRYGSSLSGWIYGGGLHRNGKPDIPIILDFAIQFCYGMIHAERRFRETGRPFVHRDIKPSNILVTRDRVVKVTDFGLVKAFADLDEDIPTTIVGDGVNRRFGLSKSGSVCGTPPYMSPEQCQGSRDIDVRSDIYTFGCVLYEMFTRELVFGGRTMDEFIKHHLKTKPRSPNVQRDLDTVVMKCLEKRPADRYADFRELEGVLSSIYWRLTGKEVKEPDAVPVASGDMNKRGLSLLSLGQKQEAISSFLEALRMNPDDCEAHNNLGDAHKAQGKLDEAIREYQEALKIAPDQSVAHSNLAKAYQAQGKSDEALREHQCVLRLRADYSWAHVDMGNVYKAQGRLDEAVREYREALRINPNYGRAHSRMGDAYKAQGKLDEAIREYREVLTMDPDDPKGHGHRALARAYQAQGELDEAVREYREALKRSEALEVPWDCADLHQTIGELCQAQGKLDEAIGEYREALKGNPDSSITHDAMLNVYKTKGELDKAIRECQEELRVNPNQAKAHLRLGNAYKAQGQLDKAVREYQRALKIDPDESYDCYHCRIGNAYEAQGELAEAIREYQEAVRIDPNYAWAHIDLGNAYGAQGKLDLAIREYQEAVRIDPNQVGASPAAAHLHLGNAYEAQGKLDLAINEYREALKRYPDCTEAHFHLALGIEAAGKRGDAVEQWRRYLAVAWGVPDQKERIPEAQQHIERLEKELQ